MPSLFVSLQDKFETRKRKLLSTASSCRNLVRVTGQLVQLADSSFLRKPPKTTSRREVDRDRRRRAHRCCSSTWMSTSTPTPARSSSRTAPAARCRGELPHPPLPRGTGSHRHPLPASTTSATRASRWRSRRASTAKAIEAWMGHSSINVTLDRYGYLFPELDPRHRRAPSTPSGEPPECAKPRASRRREGHEFDRTSRVPVAAASEVVRFQGVGSRARTCSGKLLHGDCMRRRRPNAQTVRWFLEIRYAGAARP